VQEPTGTIALSKSIQVFELDHVTIQKALYKNTKEELDDEHEEGNHEATNSTSNNPSTSPSGQGFEALD
jgi:hypothetical protein